MQLDTDGGVGVGMVAIAKVNVIDGTDGDIDGVKVEASSMA